MDTLMLPPLGCLLVGGWLGNSWVSLWVKDWRREMSTLAEHQIQIAFHFISPCGHHKFHCIFLLRVSMFYSSAPRRPEGKGSINILMTQFPEAIGKPKLTRSSANPIPPLASQPPDAPRITHDRNFTNPIPRALINGVPLPPQHPNRGCRRATRREANP